MPHTEAPHSESPSSPRADGMVRDAAAQDIAVVASDHRRDSTPLLLRIARFLPRAVMVAVMVLVGLLLVGVIYRVVGARGRDLLNRTWSRVLLRVCGMRLIVRGQPLLRGPVLVVGNHVSWIDIFLLNAVRPTAFVAKAEIRSWPVIGWLVAGAGTLFIQRGHRHAVHKVSEAMQARFANNEAVGLFPEGTTTEGFSLLSFHSSLFEPARHTGVAIQPVALRFLKHGRRDPFAAFVGTETLVGNLWRIMGVRGLSVEVVYAPALALHDAHGTPYTRVQLAAMARNAIQENLSTPTPDPASCRN